MNKEMLKAVRADMTAALAAVAAKHGLKSLVATNCTYDPAGAFTFKVEGVTADGVDRNAALYDRERDIFGLPPRGTKFAVRGVTHEIVGMTSGGKVLTKVAGTSGQYKWNADAAKVNAERFGVQS